MIIDDDASTTHIIKSMLEDNPLLMLKFRVFTDATLARREFEVHTPDLVITDINMPNVDGYELISYFKKISNTPILAITYSPWGIGNTNLALTLAQELGADYTLCKSNLAKDISPIVTRILLPEPP